MVELKVPTPQELKEKYKDELEEETGVFHWKDENGNYIPLNRMSEQGIRRAIHVCEKSQESLQITMERKIEALHHQMCAWQYREDMLTEHLEAMETAPTKTKTGQPKELTE